MRTLNCITFGFAIAVIQEAWRDAGILLSPAPRVTKPPTKREYAR
jgi:hypothetical protein